MTNTPRHPINKYAPPTPLPPPPPPKRGDEAKWASYDKRYNDILSRLNSLSSDLESFKSREDNPSRSKAAEGGRTHTFNLSTDELYCMSSFAVGEQNCNREFEIEVNVTGLGRTLSIKCLDCGREELITSSDNW